MFVCECVCVTIRITIDIAQARARVFEARALYHHRRRRRCRLVRATLPKCALPTNRIEYIQGQPTTQHTYIVYALHACIMCISHNIV